MSSPATTQHRPVLLRETLQALQLQPGLTVVDGTVGAAGHSAEILQRIRPGGRLIGLDRDTGMLNRAATRLAASSPEIHLPEDVLLKQSSYAELGTILEELNIPHVDRLLVDLGLSSDQLADRERGFGFSTTGLLDMRFDESRGEPVSTWLNRADVAEITNVLTEFGEEPWAAEIAAEVVLRRRLAPLEQVQQLSELVQSVYTRRHKRQEKSHPATRTFQALRIFVNSELEHLQRFVAETAPRCLPPGGVLAVITFHSLEDRMVKQAFSDRAVWQSASKKPVIASALEIKMNPRSRSAKLRIGIRADQEIDHISSEL